MHYENKDTFFYEILEKIMVCKLGNLNSVHYATRILNSSTNRINPGTLLGFFAVTVI